MQRVQVILIESLFINVPVQKTIDIIVDEVYSKHTNGLPPLNLSEKILRDLLKACTTDSPFRAPNGKLYTQKEGVAMGSPLGPLFANFYMAYVENIVLSDNDTSPFTYARYCDDIFIEVRDLEHLKALIEKLEQNSVLHFTYELSRENTLPFLDILVESDNTKFTTSVYRKPTNNGVTMNGNSECPERYKASVLRSFVKRAIGHSSTYEKMNEEFTRVKQLLVNNGYSNNEVDTEIHSQLQQREKPVTPSKVTHNVYYKNYMNTAYKTDERVLKDIIRRNTQCKDNEELHLHIYYTTQKTKHLTMRNSPAPTATLKRTNVVYKFACPHEGCRPHAANYIGVTTTTLSRRLTMHLQHGTLKEHMTDEHNTTLTRDMLVQNTTIIASTDDTHKLGILEALLILHMKPTLNIQVNTQQSLSLWGGG